MENIDDSENNAKISDSAYSNSCSNSQSRRSRSSKSTHSGSNSNSSGSSGYGGKPSTSGSSNLGPPPKKEKEPKKKKQAQTAVTKPDVQVETETSVPPEPTPEFVKPKEDTHDVAPILSPVEMHVQADMDMANMDIDSTEINNPKEEVAASFAIPVSTATEGFSCVISMQDGVIMYTTPSLTAILGFPGDMWTGRSFIDFVHPRDRSILASHITNGLAEPNTLNGQEKVQRKGLPIMVCRIRRYRGLVTGFGVKERAMTFQAFSLKLTFRNVSDDESKATYLVIQATPFFSAFKAPHEVLPKVTPFVIRHSANGSIEYMDPEAVPYTGYIPQDLVGTNALLLYHSDDLNYLNQAYKTFVKDGCLQRSMCYRMLIQNGGYVKVETEWSSFVNPWSRKLEFVLGKHHIVEGPANPDVFHRVSDDKTEDVSEQESNKAQSIRDKIMKTLNEIHTKPVEVVKQQISKQCQDLASFMETLLEEQPKTDEELRLEIHDPDNSCFERDSVMLGGISPHHDYNDSKSSTDTPVSYNQLNYNENLERYFASQKPPPSEDHGAITDESILGIQNTVSTEQGIPNHCFPPMLIKLSSPDTCPQSVVYDHNTVCQYAPIHLTEHLLSKHNTEMEKVLIKCYRENRSSSKGEREKTTNENKQKKKEHLARCNASFQPTSAVTSNDTQPHGVKRSSKFIEPESSPSKHHCASFPRQSRRRQRTLSTSAAVIPHNAPANNETATPWTSPPVNNMNTFFLGVGIQQQMPIVGHVPAMPSMIPMYYAPAATTSNIPVTTNAPEPPSTSTTHFQQPQMQCMMYGQPMYGPPIMYSPINQQMPYVAPSVLTQSMQYTNAMYPLGLTSSNYEEVCKRSLAVRTGQLGISRRIKIRAQAAAKMKDDMKSADSNSSTKALNRDSGTSVQSENQKSTLYSSDMKSSNSYCAKYSGASVQSGNQKSTLYSSDMKSSNSYSAKSTEVTPDPRPTVSFSANGKVIKNGNNEDTIDRTDGESSYSSFYSSFFKTESGSAEESEDHKKKEASTEKKNGFNAFQTPMDVGPNHYEYKGQKVARRKMEPPWLDQVCVTSELIYKYQVMTKTMEEVLDADKVKIAKLEQPSLVNDQLSQLYMDLHLEGAAAKLTLEEGITSSSSSSEDTATNKTNVQGNRRKRAYSKLVMIYEEDAPLPPPSSDAETEETNSEAGASQSKA